MVVANKAGRPPPFQNKDGQIKSRKDVGDSGIVLECVLLVCKRVWECFPVSFWSHLPYIIDYQIVHILSGGGPVRLICYNHGYVKIVCKKKPKITFLETWKSTVVTPFSVLKRMYFVSQTNAQYFSIII